MVRKMVFAALTLSIVALALSLASLYEAFHSSPATTVVKVVSKPVELRGLARYLSEFISIARSYYAKHRESASLSGLARELVLRGKVVNSSFIRIGSELFRYAVIRLRIGPVSYGAKVVELDGVEVKEVPRNASVTYTGGIPTNFVLKWSGGSCRFRVWTIGFVIESHGLYGFSAKLCAPRTYFVAVWMGLSSYAWLLLEKAG